MLTGKFCFRAWIFCILWIMYCGGCILWVNNFAKIHISLPKFPTPIFIGELLLLMGIIFSWPEIVNSSLNTKRIIIVSFIVLFVATAIGFIQYGPLTLRHAVLFTYVFFAFFLYHHTARGQILAVIGLMLYAVFLPVRFGFPGNGFYAFSVWVLVCFAFDIILKGINIVKTKRFIYLFIFAILTVPLYLLFYTARTFIVANFVSFLCLFSGTLMIVRVSVVKKIIFLILCIGGLLGCVYFLADRNALRSIVNIKEIISAIKVYDQEYLRLKKDFKLKDIPVSVYRPVGQEDRSSVPVIPTENPKTVLENTKTVTENPKIVTENPKTVNENPSISSLAITTARIQTAVSANDAQEPLITKHIIVKTELRDYENAKQNLLFRIFVWKGLFEDLFEKRAFFGFGLGKPLRPKTAQALGWTQRLYNIDGWISAHNSWFQLIYFFGILGVFLSLLVWYMWVHMFFRAVQNKDFWGVFLCSALSNFMVAACSQPLLEQPHYAIFFWGLWGIVFRKVYAYKEI